MTPLERRARAAGAFGTGTLLAGLALALVASGCGTGASTQKSTPVVAKAAGAPVATAAVTPHLTILAPRAGARTGSTLTVHVTVSGAPAGGAPRLRYVLDRRLVRFGSERLTLHGLAPGRHTLEVRALSSGAARASTTFTVRAPAPVAIPMSAQAPAGAVAAPPSTPTNSAPQAAPPTHTVPAATRPAPAPAPPTTSAPAPPPSTSPSPPSGGIPQGGGGDGDSDNSGGPSDGDGNV
jgi:hypothetical protein